MLRKLLVCAALFALPAAAFAEEIELTSGEILRATVIEEGSDRLVVDHPLLGVLSIDRSTVVGVRATPEGTKFPQPVASTGKAPAAGPAPAKAKAEPKPEWKFAAEFGLNGSSGNADNLNFHAGIAGKKKTDDYRWKFRANWDKTRADHETTKDQKSAFTQFDYLLEDSKFFPFANARWDTDEFVDYDHRLILGAGVGYEIHKGDEWLVMGRVGANAVREWRGMDDGWRAEALIGLDAEWDVNKSQDFEVHSTYYPDLDDSGEYRWVTSAAWAWLVDKENNMKLKIGIENERDSHREDPFDDNDFRYFIALLFEF